MKIVDRNAQVPQENKTSPAKRPIKKNLSKQEIRDLVSANKKKMGKGETVEDNPLKDPQSDENQKRLRGALENGTVTFSPKERAVLEKLLSP